MESTLELMGGARFAGSAGRIDGIERRTAACLAYLAVERRASRARLAALLWPEAESAAGRANLRQMLHRLRAAAGEELTAGSDPLALADTIAVDVRRLLALAASEEWSAVARFDGGLLPGLVFDDCEELDAWLHATRVRLDALRAHALGVESARSEQEGRHAETRATVLRWLGLDPLSEEAHRRLMRAHFADGDRGAALAAYARCRELLARQLDVEPSEPTLALARQIGASPAPRRGRLSTRRSIPLSVLRPPLLAGRDKSWAELERGWDKGHLLVIVGEPGVGKSRLMQDFAESRKGYSARFLVSRPADRLAPYAFQARAFRYDLDVDPHRLDRLPRWARRELSRIIPRLDDDPPPPLASEAERLRFFEANVEMAKLNDLKTILCTDDAHNADDASQELTAYMASRFIPPNPKDAAAPAMTAFRSSEMPEFSRNNLETLADAGLATLVTLEPLDASDVHQLIRSVDLPALEPLAERLHAYAGGVPFFIVETLRRIVESDEHEMSDLELEPSDRVRRMIERRVERLPPLARLLLYTAALLERLSFALAERLVGGDAQELAVAWQELESAQLLRGGIVSHDLLRETVLSSMPEEFRKGLHGRVAECLADAGADAAVIAEHWLMAEEPARAIPYLERAARFAADALRPEDAARFRRRIEELGDG